MTVIDPADYNDVIEYWRGAESGKNKNLREVLARKVFAATAAYDAMISAYFADHSSNDAASGKDPVDTWAPEVRQTLALTKVLRYGENSHQKAAFYRSAHSAPQGLAAATFLQGKELSYNNYVDIDAAAAIVSDLAPLPAMTIIKHTNPCGTAASATLSPKELFTTALSSDPKCAFGGIVASNIKIDEHAARAMSEIFLECVIAPDYTDAALAVFSAKKNLRVLKSDAVTETGGVKDITVNWRSVNGGILAQTADAAKQDPATWTCVSNAKPTATMLADLQFAMTVCKHVKSNAILIASGLRTIGVGPVR